MHETAAERERRLARQITINSWYGNLGDLVIDNWWTNPCAEIVMTSSRLCTLGTNPLVKFNKFNFKF